MESRCVCFTLNFFFAFHAKLVFRLFLWFIFEITTSYFHMSLLYLSHFGSKLIFIFQHFSWNSFIPQKCLHFRNFRIITGSEYNSKVEINPAIEQLFDLHICVCFKSSVAPLLRPFLFMRSFDRRFQINKNKLSYSMKLTSTIGCTNSAYVCSALLCFDSECKCKCERNKNSLGKMQLFCENILFSRANYLFSLS